MQQFQQPMSSESSAESQSTSPRVPQQRDPSPFTPGQLTKSQSDSTLTELDSPSMSPSQPRNSFVSGAKPKSHVRVPSYVSADEILDKASSTRTLRVSAEDVAAFTEMLNEFRKKDYLFARRVAVRDPSVNSYAANYFHGLPSLGATPEPKQSK
jgi:hypothetical protein